MVWVFDVHLNVCFRKSSKRGYCPLVTWSVRVLNKPASHILPGISAVLWESISTVVSEYICPIYMSANKGYSEQLALYTKAFEPGTVQSKKRKSYPGDTFPPRCDDKECVNRKEGLEKIGCTTYSLCEVCRKKVPCGLTFFKQAPSPLVIPPKKQKRADIALFSAYCLIRDHKDSLEERRAK